MSKFLTKDEIKELVQEIREGSNEARWTLILRYQPHFANVASQALKFMSYDQERFCSLRDILCTDLYIKAYDEVHKFDPEIASFPKFMEWHAFNTIQLFFQHEFAGVYMPKRAYNELLKVKKAVAALEKNGDVVTYASVESMIDVSPKQVRALMPYVNGIIVNSIDSPIARESSQEGSRTYLDILQNEHAHDGETVHISNEQFELCMNALQVLSERERDMVVRYYIPGDCKAETLETIGDHYNLSKERVRQITSESVQKMREYIYEGAG